ncbi:TPA: hypothetical protein IBX13_005052 [Escherichia coli]|nr:hypothetical protein [Escherichia coli]
MHRMNSLFYRVMYSRFMLSPWSFLGLPAVLFLASCFAGWRAFAVMVLAYGATLCLIHSFQLGNVPYRLLPKRRYRPASRRIVVWSWVVWFVGYFMLVFSIFFLKELYQLAFLLGGVCCAALHKHQHRFHKGDSWIR